MIKCHGQLAEMGAFKKNSYMYLEEYLLFKYFEISDTSHNLYIYNRIIIDAFYLV